MVGMNKHKKLLGRRFIRKWRFGWYILKILVDYFGKTLAYRTILVVQFVCSAATAKKVEKICCNCTQQGTNSFGIFVATSHDDVVVVVEERREEEGETRKRRRHAAEGNKNQSPPKKKPILCKKNPQRRVWQTAYVCYSSFLPVAREGEDDPRRNLVRN